MRWFYLHQHSRSYPLDSFRIGNIYGVVGASFGRMTRARAVSGVTRFIRPTGVIPGWCGEGVTPDRCVTGVLSGTADRLTDRGVNTKPR